MHLLTWIIVGMVWSMSLQVSDIKVVFDRLFRHLWREREKTKKMKKLLNRKTLQINLKRNDNQSGSIFMNMQCIVGSPEGKIYSRIFRIYHISLLKLLYFTDIKRRCWITERQTRKKSAKPKNTFSVTVFCGAVPAGLNRMFHWIPYTMHDLGRV